MKKCINNRSWKAILLVCAWAVLVLCGPVSVHSTKANADGVGSETKIEVWASWDYGGDSHRYQWGTFYRGIQLPDNSYYEKQYSAKFISGYISWQWSDEDFFDPDTNSYELGDLNSSYQSDLYESGDHLHDFTSRTGDYWGCCDAEGNPDDSGDYHLAECDCGFKLQVAHRPSTNGDGTCADCGVELDGDYTNTYTFTIPERFPDESAGESWEENGGIVATIQIPVTAHLFYGYILTLFLNCDGLLTSSESGYSIPYMIEEVTYVDETDWSGKDYWSCFVPSCDGTDEAIWTYTASEGDPMDEADIMASIAGTITITLTLGLDAGLYSGEYSGELTFTAVLEEA